jgi:hypothetical protein
VVEKVNYFEYNYTNYRTGNTDSDVAEIVKLFGK